ncbi:MAG: flagellin [Planctomycetota bacterium]
MARINSNIAAMTARVNLNRANEDLAVRFQRLSTGLRINRGADDPAGLIVSERLRTELEGISQGIRNSERASNVIATTEGALTEVSDLLNSIKALVVEAANTGAFSREEVAANQLQIDSAIDSITRISNTATFAGLKLLNGELGYILSGVSAADLPRVRVNGITFGDRDSIPVNVDMIGSAQTAQIFMRTDFSNINAGFTDGVLPFRSRVEFQSNEGVQVIEFVSNASSAQIRDGINTFRSTTGLSASFVNGNPVSGISISSLEYGSDAFVSVRQLSDVDAVQFGKVANNSPIDPNALTFGTGAGQIDIATVGQGELRDDGKDAIALVNGVLATANGLDLSVRSRALDVELLLDAGFATQVGVTTRFDVTGGGSIFQLGPQVNTNQQVNIGIDSIASTRLGGTLVLNSAGTGNVVEFLESLKSGGLNALGNDREAFASDILDTAIDEISSLRGRLGAFERNVIQTNINSLEASLENITASESVIRDADFALETSALTRAQVLTQAGTSVLAQANANAQNVLQLLG